MSQLQQNLTLQQLDQLRNNILANIKFIELNKHLIRSHDRTKLQNHHNYVLETLDNMVNIKRVEMADPYNSWNAEPNTNSMGGSRQQVIYNPDGTTSVVDQSQFHTNGEEWEHQFDSTQLMNPPCYMMPPQNLSSIPRIKRASQSDRLQRQTQMRRGLQ